MVDWTLAISAAGTAMEHRDEIVGIWSRITNKWRGSKTSIAFTGIEAAGKTVLCDYVTGKAYSAGYQLPPRSVKEELGRVRTKDARLALSVVPGQPSSPRNEALDKLLDTEPVDGIVHVVCYGFNETRSALSQQKLLEDGRTSLSEYRAYQLEREYEDLDRTCELIRHSVRASGKPKWLIVAVTKSDLFRPELGEAEKYYSEAGDSRFSGRLRSLERQVGTDNFRWTAIPVCSCLKSFIWNSTTVIPTISEAERNSMVAEFSRQLEAHCA